MPKGRLWIDHHEELPRRSPLFQVLLALSYAVAAWLCLQFADGYLREHIFRIVLAVQCLLLVCCRWSGCVLRGDGSLLGNGPIVFALWFGLFVVTSDLSSVMSDQQGFDRISGMTLFFYYALICGRRLIVLASFRSS